jgi:hypothetical protein
LLLFLALGWIAAAAGRSSAPEVAFVFPEIRIPLPKLHVAYVSRAVPGFGSVAPSLTDLRPGVVCGGVSEASELDYPADGLIDLFGSVEDYRTALAATKVEIVALRPVVDEFVTPSENAERAVTLREEDASILKAVLTYDPAYDWTAASRWLSGQVPRA